jgi:hypothetical protein
LGHPAGTGYTFWGHSIAIAESGLVYPFFKVLFYAEFPSFALATLVAQAFSPQVEGHTDNVPVSPRLQDTFPSNWELSTARASNVVRFLQDRVGIPGERLSSCGFGQYRPLADNTTAAGRAENRRIQIVLVPLEAQAVAKPE